MLSFPHYRMQASQARHPVVHNVVVIESGGLGEYIFPYFSVSCTVMDSTVFSFPNINTNTSVYSVCTSVGMVHTV